MTQTKIQGKFYPLTNGITTILRQAKLTAAEWRIWSYLVEIDPWGDRYEDFDYLSVISACDCSKPTFYRAIAKFQELKIFDFQSRGLSLRNLTGVSHLDKSEPEPTTTDSQPKTKPKPKPKPETEQDITNECPTIHKNKPDAVSKMRIQFQKRESSLKNETPVSKMRTESQNCNNEGLKRLSDIQFASPQTLQIKLDPPDQPDRGGEDLNSQYEEVSQSEQVAPKKSNLTQNEQVESKKSKVQNKQIKANETTLDTREEKDVPRAVTQNKTEIIREAKETPRKNIDKSELPQDLVNWMEELTIPLDEKVLKAIANHDISQAYGACRHVEETWETIDNPKSIFLYQIPKQKIEKLGPQLPEIGPKMREENAAIEKEMASDEYKAKSKEMFAKFRERFGKGGKKK